MSNPKYKYPYNTEEHKRYKRQFLSTFQRERGFPKPSRRSRRSNPAGGTTRRGGSWRALEVAPRSRQPSGPRHLMHRSEVILTKLCDEGNLCLGCYQPSTTIMQIPFWSMGRLKIVLLPLCEADACRMKAMEAYRVGRNKAVKRQEMTMVNEASVCYYCHRPEDPEGHKFFKCGRCRVQIYCSKQCQVRYVQNSCKSVSAAVFLLFDRSSGP